MIIKRSSALLYDRENDTTGIVRVSKQLSEEFGSTPKQVRQLISRYPAVLSKSDEHISSYFNTLAKYDIDNEQAMAILV